MSHPAQTRQLLWAVLVFTLAAVAGCKKTEKPAAVAPAPVHQETAQAPPPPVNRDAEPAQPSEPPSSIFNLNNASVLTPVDIHKLTPTQIQYGIAPTRSKDVEYQDGVIIMEQGDKAIRSMAGDGMRWTFDANAPHVNEFQEGKIVFATGLAVGKIVGLKREGDQVSAVLAPIQLTDVIKNGAFAMNQPINTDNMLTYAAPNFPQPPDPNPEQKTSSLYDEQDDHVVQAVVLSRVKNGKWTQSSMSQTLGDGRRITYERRGTKWTDARVSLSNVSPLKLINSFERIRLSTVPSRDPEIPERLADAEMSPQSAGPAGAPVDLDVDDAKTTGVASNSGIGLQFYYDKKGVKVFAECLLATIGATVEFKMVIQNGQFVTAGIKIGGDLGIKIMAEAGTTGDFSANLHKIFWEPIDFKIPLGLNSIGPVPMSVTFNSMLSINTGFSAKLSTLKAEGYYTFGGGLWAGLDHGTWSVTPAKNPIADKDLGMTTTGISLGINSLVVASALRAMVGVGAFGFNTGVFADIRFDGTLLRAPDEAFPCRQGTVGAFLDYGIGYSLPKIFVDVLNKILSLFTSYQIERVGTIAQSKAVELFHGNTQVPGSCATPAKSGD